MTNYVRQSSFSNGDIIDATALNAEYDQLVATFTAGTGHSHSGDVGEGGYVPLISLEDNSTSVRVDDTDPLNHKVIFKIDGVDVLTVAEDVGLSADKIAIAIEELNNVNAPLANGFFRWNAGADTVEFLATNGALKDTTDIGTPVNLGYWKWDASSSEVIYSATIAHTDITGLDSANFTHNAANMQTFLDGLSAQVIDAAADAAAAAADAAAALVSAAEAEVSADRAETAAMAVGVPVVVNDLGTYVIPETAEIADVIFKGDGTLTLPTTLVIGRRFYVHLHLSAVGKTVQIPTGAHTITGNIGTIPPANILELIEGDVVVLEVVSLTELEIL